MLDTPQKAFEYAENKFRIGTKVLWNGILHVVEGYSYEAYLMRRPEPEEGITIGYEPMFVLNGLSHPIPGGQIKSLVQVNLVSRKGSL